MAARCERGGVPQTLEVAPHNLKLSVASRKCHIITCLKDQGFIAQAVTTASVTLSLVRVEWCCVSS